MRIEEISAIIILLALFDPENRAKAETIGIQDSAPYFVEGKDGKAAGFFNDVALEISKRSGVNLSIRSEPLARVSAEIQNGNLDFAIRSEIPGVTELGLVTDFPIIVVARPGISLKVYEDLYKIASITYSRGTFHNTKVQHDPKLKLTESVDAATALRMLTAGHTDAYYGAACSFVYLAGINGVKAALGDTITVGQGSFVLLASPRSSSLPASGRLKAALASMRDDGTIKSIFSKYMNSDWSPN